MSKLMMLLMLFGAAAPSAAADCAQWREEKLFLLGWECLSGRDEPDSRSRFEEALSRERAGAHQNLWETYYFEGLEAWKHSRFLEARNAWVKFSALCRLRCGGKETSRLDEVEPYLTWVEFALEEEGREDDGESLEPKKRESTVKKTSSRVFKKSQKGPARIRESRQFLKRAKLAAAAGDFGLAVRLASLSADLNPSWEEPPRWIRKWEKSGENSTSPDGSGS